MSNESTSVALSFESFTQLRAVCLAVAVYPAIVAAGIERFGVSFSLAPGMLGPLDPGPFPIGGYP